MKKLNTKEQAVFDYILKLTNVFGYAPSVREICEALGYKSTSTVQMYLERLLEYGYLLREDGKSRSLRVNTAMYEQKEGIPIVDAERIRLEEAWESSIQGYTNIRKFHLEKGVFLMRIGQNAFQLPVDAYLLCKVPNDEKNRTAPSVFAFLEHSLHMKARVLAILDADTVDSCLFSFED